MTPIPTPLVDEHERLGGRMIDFAGHSLPVQYQSIIDEAAHVRKSAGLFDLCHMGRVRVHGEGHLDFVDRLVTCDATSIPLGAARYGLLTREDGTIIDDLLIYRDVEATLLCINGANRSRDLAWLNTHAAGTPVTIEDRTAELAMIALQGPAALDVAAPHADQDPAELRYYTFRTGTFCGIPDVLISRTGYTGEDGIELWVPAAEAPRVWRALLESTAHEVRPIGLGARDTLRLEAGMPLYGHEIDDSTTPIEAGLSWAVDLSRSFVGDEAIRDLSERGTTRKLVGFRCDGKRVPRFGYPVLIDGDAAGQVRSGALSPAVDGPIGTAYVPVAAASPGTPLQVDFRGKPAPAEVVKLPFYKRARR